MRIMFMFNHTCLSMYVYLHKQSNVRMHTYVDVEMYIIQIKKNVVQCC